MKMRQFSEGMEDIDGKEIHFDIGPDTLSFTARNLPNFATYTFQVVSLTKYGEGTHSSIKIASKYNDIKNTVNLHTCMPACLYTSNKATVNC